MCKAFLALEVKVLLEINRIETTCLATPQHDFLMPTDTLQSRPDDVFVENFCNGYQERLLRVTAP